MGQSSQARGDRVGGIGCQGSQSLRLGPLSMGTRPASCQAIGLAWLPGREGRNRPRVCARELSLAQAGEPVNPCREAVSLTYRMPGLAGPWPRAYTPPRKFNVYVLCTWLICWVVSGLLLLVRL